jgi:hypothetical protein
MFAQSWLTARHIAILTGASVTMLVMSAIATPWLLSRLPADYFSHPKPHLWERLKTGTPGRKLLLVAKNLGGLVLVVAGLAMLVLPGQGLLTMLMGLVLIDFPKKFELERWLISRPSLFATVNWLRRRGGHPPLELRD